MKTGEKSPADPKELHCGHGGHRAQFATLPRHRGSPALAVHHPHGTRMSGEVPADAAKLKWRSHELTGKTREEDHESWMKRCGTRAFTRVRAPHTHETLRFGVPPPTRSCCRQTVSSLKQSPPCLTRAPPPAFLTASAVRQMGGWSDYSLLLRRSSLRASARSCSG